MKRRIQKFLIGLCMGMVLLSGCSDEGEVSYGQTAESSQVASVESSDGWIPKDVEDALSRNCYQAFHGYVSELKEAEWEGFQLSDVDGDKIDELIAVRKDPKNIEQDNRRYYLLDWEDRKITVVETQPSAQADSRTTVDKLEYYDKDYMLLILNVEGKSYIEGVTKKDKDFFHLLVGIAWVEEGWADEPRERRDAMEDYLVVSELGERTNSRYSSSGADELLYQYKMPTAEVTEFYKDVYGWDRAFSPDHDSTSEIGVCNRSNGYLYGENKIGWSDYSVITKVERSENEITICAIMKSIYTDNCLADVKVLITPKEGRFGYALTGYEVVRETGVDPESGRLMEEFQGENLWIQYIMQSTSYPDVVVPVVKDLRYMENDEELFTANAKQLLTELKKEYEANPGSDGSNVAAKSTLLGQYEIANNSKLLIYEDAVYGKVPPATGEGSEYGYYLNYCLLTPGYLFTYGEIFHYNESFGDMPADRRGASRCHHYFLGSDSQGDPAIDMAKFARGENYAEELMFYAAVGRSHDMTVDEEGCERYDEDSYLYGAYFRPDGTRIINQYSTWQVATLEYVSNGAFIKDPKGKTLFEEKSGTEGHEYYVEGKKVPIEKKQEETEETFCDVTLDDTTKLSGQIYYWNFENVVNVDLVFIIDGKEAHHNLYSYKLFGR